MKLVIDIDDSTIIDLKKKQNRTEVDNAVLNGTSLIQVLDELKAMRNYYTESSNDW